MTTEIAPLIVECERAGIRLSVDGGKLVIEAPAGVVKPDLLARLRQHKPELMAALSVCHPAPVAEPSLFDARPAAPVVESDAAVKSAAVALVEQARPPAVTQPTEPTALVAALTARPGAPVPPVAERSLFDDLATPPVAQPVEATTPAAAIAPAVAAPVEPTPRLAPADAVTAPAADAQPVELPRGWPSDVPPPDWWPEFLSIKGSIEVLAARRQVCGDPGCGFEVAVEWEAPGCPRQWSCPRCGRTADQEG